jgi:MarR family multiple gene transcriptional regulator MgrA
VKHKSENIPLSLLKQVSNQLDRCRNMDFERLQLTSSQANVMLFLFANKRREVSHQDIQACLHLSHPTITGLMQRLEQKGFIERYVNPLDNRCKYVKLTEKGEKLEKKLKANSKTMEQAALAEVSPQQLEIFNATLWIISRNLKRKTSGVDKAISPALEEQILEKAQEISAA